MRYMLLRENITQLAFTTGATYAAPPFRAFAGISAARRAMAAADFCRPISAAVDYAAAIITIRVLSPHKRWARHISTAFGRPKYASRHIITGHTYDFATISSPFARCGRRATAANIDISRATYGAKMPRLLGKCRRHRRRRCEGRAHRRLIFAA